MLYESTEKEEVDSCEVIVTSFVFDFGANIEGIFNWVCWLTRLDMAFKEILDLLIDIEKDERRINLTRPNIIVMHGEISLKVLIGIG